MENSGAVQVIQFVNIQKIYEVTKNNLINPSEKDSESTYRRLGGKNDNNFQSKGSTYYIRHEKTGRCEKCTSE